MSTNETEAPANTPVTAEEPVQQVRTGGTYGAVEGSQGAAGGTWGLRETVLAGWRQPANRPRTGAPLTDGRGELGTAGALGRTGVQFETA